VLIHAVGLGLALPSTTNGPSAPYSACSAQPKRGLLALGCVGPFVDHCHSMARDDPWPGIDANPPLTMASDARCLFHGLEGHVRARAMANKPISITPPPEMRLLRIQLGPEQGTT